jgi:hypothetical protein
MAAMKLYIVGGLLLVLLSPLWILTLPLPPDESSFPILLVRMSADDWGRWLGVMAVVLGLLQKNVAVSPTARLLTAVGFLLGSILVPLGTARAFWPEEGQTALSHAAGSGLVAAVLLLNLVGVLRYRQGSSADL